MSGSCSTTRIVFPRSRRPSRILISRCVSRLCNPIDGSSSTYKVPTRRDPSDVASCMRCASPPESVDANRSSVRYSSPTSFRNRSRSRISCKSRSPISASCGLNSRPSKNLETSSTVMPHISQILRSLILTCRASSRSRLPWHSGHVEYPRYRLRNTRMCSLYFFRSRYWKNPRTPRKSPSPLRISSCCASSSSPQGTSSGISDCLANRFISANTGRYFGLFHGSIAPCPNDFVLSGITRSRSKSMVFPNPWHRAHAP